MAAIAHKGQVIMGGDAGVTSWNGRSGSVLPTAGDYDATQVNYSEQQTVKQKIDSLVTGVSSFNGRSGSILPIAGDYTADTVNYATGTTVKQKIDSVNGTWTTPASCLIGDTDVTIQNSAIHTTSTINIFYQNNTSGNPISYTSAVVTEGQIVITFSAALEEAASVKLQIIN